MKNCALRTLAVFAAVACAVSGVDADEKIPRLTVKGSLDAMVGHVQGACASEDAIYFSNGTRATSATTTGRFTPCWACGGLPARRRCAVCRCGTPI